MNTIKTHFAVLKPFEFKEQTRSLFEILSEIPLGRAGENFAQQWLHKHNYDIIARNWRTKTGEIDIIAVRKDTIVFIEVKTLLNTAFTDLDIIINQRKRERICKTAKYFLLSNRKYTRMHVRFDVLIITFDPRNKDSATTNPIHLKNAFEDCI